MGSYIDNNLITGETVVYRTGLHWTTYISVKAVLTLFIAPLLAHWSSEFCVTNKRVVMKTGLISRETLEMNLSKIESVQVEQSILGRMLGYGDVIIIGTGGTREPFRQIADPASFRRAFQEAVAQAA